MQNYVVLCICGSLIVLVIGVTSTLLSGSTSFLMKYFTKIFVKDPVSVVTKTSNFKTETYPSVSRDLDFKLKSNFQFLEMWTSNEKKHCNLFTFDFKIEG